MTEQLDTVLTARAKQWPLCVNCKHCREADWSAPRIVHECTRYPSLVDGVTIDSCAYQRGSGLCQA
jgi:hypothetical protein